MQSLYAKPNRSFERTAASGRRSMMTLCVLLLFISRERLTADADMKGLVRKIDVLSFAQES